MTGYGWDILCGKMDNPDEYDPEKLNDNYKGFQHIIPMLKMIMW